MTNREPLAPEVKEEIVAVLDEVKTQLRDMDAVLNAQEAALKEHERRWADDYDTEDKELRERIAKLTDTDIVWLVHETQLAVYAQAREGGPAPGLCQTLLAAITEMTVRFVPHAVIERVDRIFDGEAEPDSFAGRYLLEGGTDA